VRRDAQARHFIIASGGRCSRTRKDQSHCSMIGGGARISLWTNLWIFGAPP